MINSDHGYNLGEHGGMVGAYSLYRESTWTPFLIVGAHPRLPAGRHDKVVTLLDVAPTIADILGLREANPWHGHSLLAVAPGPAHPVRVPRFGDRRGGRLDRAVRRAGRARAALRQPRDWLQRTTWRRPTRSWPNACSPTPSAAASSTIT